LVLATVLAGCDENVECEGDTFTGEPMTCGTAGTVDRTVCVDGRLRAFREHVPATLNCDAPPPLILFLHGSGSNETSGDAAFDVADQLGAVFVSLRGYNQDGFVGFGPDGTENSRLFTTVVLDQVRREFPTDPHFTLLTGFSAGAFFTSYCIAWLNDRLAGVGIFGAGIAEDWTAELAAAPSKIPVVVRAGDKDSLQVYADSLVIQLKSAGWPAERVDAQRFAGGHTWTPEMIRETFNWTKAASPRHPSATMEPGRAAAAPPSASVPSSLR
jgi:predicted esterase